MEQQGLLLPVGEAAEHRQPHGEAGPVPHQPGPGPTVPELGRTMEGSWSPDHQVNGPRSSREVDPQVRIGAGEGNLGQAQPSVTWVGPGLQRPHNTAQARNEGTGPV